MNAPDETNPREELNGLRRRIVSIETDLLDLRQRVAGLEGRLGAAQPTNVFRELPPELPPLLSPAPSRVEPPPTALPLPPKLPPKPTDWSKLRAGLEQLQLLPPSGERNAEVRLGAWWATRVGALLAVIGVVFFGIYISINTPPWVKLVQLLAVTGGVAGLGLWLERRVPKFGAVVFGGALALLYFSAYAAYAVPAMQVLMSPWQAVAAQVAAVVVVFGAAKWRRSETVATMAVTLGYVAAWFSFSCGLGTLALSMAVVLAAGAAALRVGYFWEAPNVIAVPLAYAVYARVILGEWSKRTGETVGEAWLWLMGLMVVFFAADWIAVKRRGAVVTGRTRGLQSVNSSLAVLLGLAATLHLDAAALPEFYLGAAVCCALAAWAWHDGETNEALVPVLACKAAGLLALAVISQWSGSVRALVLLAQALVMLVAARESGLRGLRVMATVVWLIAGVFFAAQFATKGLQQTAESIPAVAGFVFGAALWLGWNERWLGVGRTPNVWGGVGVGVLVGVAAHVGGNLSWGPALTVGLAAAAATGGLVARGGVGPAALAGVTVLGAQAGLMTYQPAAFPAWQFWTNAAVVFGAVFAAAWAIDRRSSEGENENYSFPNWVRTGLVMTGVVTLQVTWFNGLNREHALVAAVATAVALMAGAAKAQRWPLVSASTLALGLAGGGFLLADWKPVGQGLGWLLAAGLGAWVAPAWLAGSAVRRETVVSPAWRAGLPGWQTAFAGVLTFLVLSAGYSGALRVGATALSALAVALLAWRPGLRPALTAASAGLAVGAVGCFDFGRNAMGGEWIAIALVFGLGAGLPVLARRWVGAGAAGWLQWAAWVHPFAAWLGFAWVVIRQEGALAPYATMLGGTAAIGVFLLGLSNRERAARLAGLSGLALCIPRVFIVDIDSTLYRIGAFFVLGVVLLWVGFSYHRFRHLIANDGGEEVAGRDKKL